MNKHEDAINRMAEQFRKADEARERHRFLRNNPHCLAAQLTRLFVFLFTTLLWGSFFMGLFYLVYLVEGGWWSWLKYYSYGTGASVGLKASLHRNVFP